MPQSAGLLVRSAQAPEQLVSPPPHVVPQEPAEHTLPPPHEFPQLPQLPLSACVLTSQPFPGLPSQSANPAAQAPIAHVPVAQVAPALG